MPFLKLIRIHSVALVLVLLPVFVLAGNIVYPWRAVPAFAKAGCGFSILYDNPGQLKIDSVILVGPYNRIKLTIDSINIGRFEYDSFTKSSVNSTIWVKVPKTAPEEIYDLIVCCGKEIQMSPRSVKVVLKFSPSHRFIHISDLHISRQWVGTPEDGYSKELELLDRFVEVANIIAPDFIIMTGDAIHHYTLFDADSLGWGENKVYDAAKRPLVEEKYRNYYEGAKGFCGVNGFNAPVFSLPGNHDFYGVSKNDHQSMALQWNQMCGKRVYGFSYAGTRVMAADDFLGDPVSDIPDQSPMSGLQGKYFESFLNKNGRGKLIVMAQHRHDRIDTSFINRNRVGILLNGHNHTPFEKFVGTTPTLSTRPGAVCRSGEIKNWKETLGFFRIFSIKGGSYTYTAPLRFCKNPTTKSDQPDLNLTLHYKNPNDGTSVTNEAKITNSFGVTLPKCKIRFVMEKGKYKVTGGKVHQLIQTDLLTIVDVYTCVKSNCSKLVEIVKD